MLSLLVSGAAHFLAGERKPGIKWFVGLTTLHFLFVLSLGSSLIPGLVPGIIIGIIAIGLWGLMLVKSYRPLPPPTGWTWIGVLGLWIGSNLALSYGESAFVRRFNTPTGAMAPTIQGNTLPDGTRLPGDHFFVEKCAYWFSKPARGDVVVFRTENVSPFLPPSQFYVKRVAGIPGDALSIKGARLMRNGALVREPAGLARLKFPPIMMPKPGYLSDETNSFTVPPGQYFVIGDNTTNSMDSRFFGPIPANSIIGRVSKIYWPPSRMGKVQ